MILPYILLKSNLLNYFLIDKIFNLMIPTGAWTSTTLFLFLPNNACPIGDSFEILLATTSTSVEPTIVYSTVSSNSTSNTLTMFPTWTTSVSISDSSIIFAYFIFSSNSAILISFCQVNLAFFANYFLSNHSF